MKDRYKIFWTCLSLALFISILIGSLSASFKKVQLRQYGILYYSAFSKVANQSARGNGNYLVGLDYEFHKFPSGILCVEVRTTAVTKDMGVVDVTGMFTGRLVVEEVMAMYEGYGFEYQEFLRAEIEEFVREGIEIYSLSQLIENRQAVQNNVRAQVCLKIQTSYSWIQCDYFSLGRIGSTIPSPPLLPPEETFELKKIELLNRELRSQKVLNFYKSGGYRILKEMEARDSDLFLQVTNMLVDGVSGLPSGEARAAAAYSILGAKFPVLNNTLTFQI